MTNARQVRWLDPVRRVDSPSSRDGGQQRLHVCGCGISPLRIRRRTERQRPQFGESEVHPKVDGSDDRHRSEEVGCSPTRKYVTREEPQAADWSEQTARSILT